VGSILISLVDFSLHVAVAIFMQVHHFGVWVRVRVRGRGRVRANPNPNL
jgi:ATP-dependent Clp protease adapter protein ClpS